eukprot:TRINITY_DN163_c0_g1_i1.p1 TRINITY_DN163_c0_g1~~TRINITY_DN163_c0_g1_i1.p1  ORF type:complete len:1141 (-),score=466.52 TRINITY_DN163_c0_g1_i1:95-3517(-)
MASNSSTSGLSILLPKLYYATGESVHGKVKLELKTDRRINSIVIHLTGSEFCENSVLADIPFQRKWILDGSTTLYGNKVKMNRNGTIQRVGIPPESSAVLIKAGSYAWPFSFSVPKNIPPSALYKNGKVKIGYLLHVIVDVPWSKSMRITENIRIGIPYCIDPLKSPVVYKNEKKFVIHHNHGRSGSSLLKLEASVDKPVTFTGDKLNVHVSVENYSGRTVYSLKCKLKQIWVFGSGYFEKSTVTKIKHKDRGFPLESGNYKGTITLAVPNCDLKPTIQSASLIRSSYHITVIAVARATPLRVRIPIVMGSFPPVSSGTNQSSSLVEAPTEYVPKEQHIAELNQTTQQNEVQAAEPILIDWDAPAPGQFDNRPDLERPLVPESLPYNPPIIPSDLGINWANQGARGVLPPGHSNNNQVVPPQFTQQPAYQPQQVPPVVQPAAVPQTQPFQFPQQPVYQPQQVVPAMVQPVHPPSAFSLSPLERSFHPSEQQMANMQFEKSMKEIKDCSTEFDSAVQWSAYLSEDMALSNPSSNLQVNVASLNTMTKAIAPLSEEICRSAQAKNIKGFNADLETLSVYLKDLVAASKLVASQMGDIKEQQNLLGGAKRLSNAVLAQADIGKELVDYNPFSAMFSEDSLIRMLNDKTGGVRDACNSLIRFSEDVVQGTVSRVNNLKERSTEIDRLIEEANNPFSAVDEKATVDDVEKTAQILSSTASLLVMASHGQYGKVLDAANKAVPLIAQLLSGTKGLKATLTRYPESTQPMFEHSKKLAKNLRMLIQTVTKAVEQGSLTHPVAVERQINEEARDVQTETSKIVEQTRAIKMKQKMSAQEEEREKKAAAKRQQEAATAALPPPVSFDSSISIPQTNGTQAIHGRQERANSVSTTELEKEVDFDKQTGDELSKAMASLATAALRLKNMKGSSPSEVRRKQLKSSGTVPFTESYDHQVVVMSATGSVANALKNLLNAAKMAQNQRVENNKAGISQDEVYHRDPTWSEGVVSAAKEVVKSMEQLIEASTSKELDDDLVETLAKSVSSSTAQLVAAERVRGDPDSEATKFLMMSAKSVATATSDLIAKTREASIIQPRREFEEVTTSSSDPSKEVHASERVKELETALRITRLEKELANARNDLMGIRKDRYQ